MFVTIPLASETFVKTVPGLLIWYSIPALEV